MTEAMTINNLGFTELSQLDLMVTNGGRIAWDEMGAVAAGGAGAVLGANIGALAGPVGIAAGGIIGAAVATGLYYLFD